MLNKYCIINGTIINGNEKRGMRRLYKWVGMSIWTRNSKEGAITLSWNGPVQDQMDMHLTCSLRNGEHLNAWRAARRAGWMASGKGEYRSEYTLSQASNVALVVKNLPANAGDVRDVGSIPQLGRPPEEGNGFTLQYSCLGNPMHRGAWWATVPGVPRVGCSWATK